MFSFFKRRNTDPGKLLAESLSGMELPTFSAATITTLQLLRDPDKPSDEIAQSVETNPGLVVHVLGMVNSAAYGLRQKVDRVSHAINLLGRGRIESLVVAMAVKGGVQKAAPSPASRRFWYAAATRATMARSVAGLLHPRTASESFVGGLLQDMALPLLQASRPDDYEPLMTQSLADGVALEELERERFGWDHSEVGACVAQRWELPEALTDAIGTHHQHGGPAPPAVHLVSHVRQRNNRLEVEPLVEKMCADYDLPADQVIKTLKAASLHARELAPLLR